MSSFLKKNELEDLTMNDVWDKSKALSWRAWSAIPRRMRLAGFCFVFLAAIVGLSITSMPYVGPYLPSVSLEYASQQKTPYNESKVALLIENRPFPLLAPLMLHFMAVVPPDWRFRFMGSIDSVEHINKSIAIQEQVKLGKLDLTYIPANMSTSSQEEISRFLTTLWLYEYVLQPAEWLLIFQTDSILCANSQRNINDYLEYDWIGAPWNPEGRWGGNGGLSIRRVSAMIDILRQQVRAPGSEPEDVWLAERLGHRPGSKVANGSVSLTFSGEMHPGKGAHVGSGGVGGDSGTLYNDTKEAAEHGELVHGIDDWREGFYEPMGYHTGGSGNYLHSGIWGTPALRKHIWDYCPEVKMTLNMDAAKYVPGSCGQRWKRDLGEDSLESRSLEDMGWGTEIIDGVEYPLLPPGLMPF